MDNKQPEKLSCIYIGLRHDRATYSNFPSVDNVCYHAQPINSPAFSHQHEYCLTNKYKECPVYASKEGLKLPEELQQTVEKKRGIKWIWVISGIVVILVVAMRLGLYWNNYIFSSSAGLPTPTHSQTIDSPNVIFTSTATTTRTNKPTQITPSLTPSPQVTTTRVTTTPSSTPTDVRSFDLESVIGQGPQFIIHRTVEGESIPLFSTLYGSSVAAITAVNHDLPPVLLIDQIIVIPINLTDPTGIPPFIAYEVLENNMTFEQISDEFSIPFEELLKYNNVNAGFPLQQGDWILIPQIGN